MDLLRTEFDRAHQTKEGKGAARAIQPALHSTSGDHPSPLHEVEGKRVKVQIPPSPHGEGKVEKGNEVPAPALEDLLSAQDLLRQDPEPTRTQLVPLDKAKQWRKVLSEAQRAQIRHLQGQPLQLHRLRGVSQRNDQETTKTPTCLLLHPTPRRGQTLRQ